MPNDKPVQRLYKSVPVKYDRRPKADILEVTKLEAIVKTHIDDRRNFETRSLILQFGIQTIASPGENVESIEMIAGQTSLDSSLNPTDFYFRANVRGRTGATAGFGSPKYSQIELEYVIDQRRVADQGKPWREPVFTANENVKHLSFDAGMLGGFNRWRMYRLDYKNVNNVMFEFVKLFSYVQGQVVDM